MRPCSLDLPHGIAAPALSERRAEKGTYARLAYGGASDHVPRLTRVSTVMVMVMAHGKAYSSCSREGMLAAQISANAPSMR